MVARLYILNLEGDQRKVAEMLYSKGPEVRPTHPREVTDVQNIAKVVHMPDEYAYKAVRTLISSGYVQTYFTRLHKKESRVYMGHRISPDVRRRP